MPTHLAADVRQMAKDFETATAAWIASGEYSAEEVAEWRDIIRRDMQSENSVNPAIDARPQEERIKAWCRTWRDLRMQIKG